MSKGNKILGVVILILIISSVFLLYKNNKRSEYSREHVFSEFSGSIHSINNDVMDLYAKWDSCTNEYKFTTLDHIIYEISTAEVHCRNVLGYYHIFKGQKLNIDTSLIWDKYNEFFLKIRSNLDDENSKTALETLAKKFREIIKSTMDLLVKSDKNEIKSEEFSVLLNKINKALP